ncbi:hypothetical protein DFA_04990 [Cavenderia fasciculata]|uniref:Uncharacterized protein n=1 Tax=Cavenderia fasciculata TaxID=261658 RepID=F4PMR3_CACFS|nr:uncharacterized protein DFA_04990 [Cavenderia fasciculata]EGG22860.1 hypothetical protein DFA_04990 [Cavenderia fasciculata]|eukprot:XP_004360711.1 hypothetical protein DFA_04990 [Cavenderia fasciculata]
MALSWSEGYIVCCCFGSDTGFYQLLIRAQAFVSKNSSSSNSSNNGGVVLLQALQQQQQPNVAQATSSTISTTTSTTAQTQNVVQPLIPFPPQQQQQQPQNMMQIQRHLGSSKIKFIFEKRLDNIKELEKSYDGLKIEAKGERLDIDIDVDKDVVGMVAEWSFETINLYDVYREVASTISTRLKARIHVADSIEFEHLRDVTIQFHGITPHVNRIKDQITRSMVPVSHPPTTATYQSLYALISSSQGVKLHQSIKNSNAFLQDRVDSFILHALNQTGWTEADNIINAWLNGTISMTSPIPTISMTTSSISSSNTIRSVSFAPLPSSISSSASSSSSSVPSSSTSSTLSSSSPPFTPSSLVGGVGKSVPGILVLPNTKPSSVFVPQQQQLQQQILQEQQQKLQEQQKQQQQKQQKQQQQKQQQQKETTGRKQQVKATFNKQYLPYLKFEFFNQQRLWVDARDKQQLKGRFENPTKDGTITISGEHCKEIKKIIQDHINVIHSKCVEIKLPFSYSMYKDHLMVRARSKKIHVCWNNFYNPQEWRGGDYNFYLQPDKQRQGGLTKTISQNIGSGSGSSTIKGMDQYQKLDFYITGTNLEDIQDTARYLIYLSKCKTTIPLSEQEKVFVFTEFKSDEHVLLTRTKSAIVIETLTESTLNEMESKIKSYLASLKKNNN